MIARRTLTDPKTALAGVLLVISFTKLNASMKPFNTEMTLSRSLGCRDWVSMVEIRGRWGRTVQRKGCVKEGPKPN